MGSGGQFVTGVGTILKLELPAGENLSKQQTARYFPSFFMMYIAIYL